MCINVCAYETICDPLGDSLLVSDPMYRSMIFTMPPFNEKQFKVIKTYTNKRK